MTVRRLLLMIASMGLAILLLLVLVTIGKVDLRAVLRLLEGVSLLSFVKIAALNALLIYFSTEKWRSIDAAWRRPADAVPSRAGAYALTSVGLAMGMVLPIQVALSSARTLGTYGYGAALKRGTAGTLIEQGFDFYTVVFLAAASAITWFLHGGARMWVVCAAMTMAAAFLAVEIAIRLFRKLPVPDSGARGWRRSRILQTVRTLQHSDLLGVRLARRLVLLSALRTGTVILMSVATAQAIGLGIPMWTMAAATPFVSLANVIALTPGGLGISDLAGAGALTVFGTPTTVAAQWVLANRVLISVSYVLLAVFGVIASSLTRGKMASSAAGCEVQGADS